LYDNDTDSADNWTDYNDILEYLNKHNFTNEEIENGYKNAMNDRKK
jgi:hypothetical protein